MHCCTLPYLDEIIPSLCNGIILFLLSRIYSSPPAFWNARSAIGTAAGSCGPCIVRWQEIISPSYFLWNARSASGTALGLLERPSGQLEQPIGLLERPSAQGKHSNTLGNTPPLIDRLHTYCRLNVVLMQTHAYFAKNPPPNCL